MGKILIWFGMMLLFTLFGLAIWWVGQNVYISIRRDEERFEIEKEGYEVAKKSIKEHET